MYEPASLGMFQCRLQRILCDFEVIMFFRKDPPQTEGRRDADPLIKTAPGPGLLLKKIRPRCGKLLRPEQLAGEPRLARL